VTWFLAQACHVPSRDAILPMFRKPNRSFKVSLQEVVKVPLPFRRHVINLWCGLWCQRWNGGAPMESVKANDALVLYHSLKENPLRMHATCHQFYSNHQPNPYYFYQGNHFAIIFIYEESLRQQLHLGQPLLPSCSF